MTDDAVEMFHQKFLDILDRYVDRGGHEHGAPVSLRVRAEGHRAIRGLVVEIAEVAAAATPRQLPYAVEKRRT